MQKKLNLFSTTHCHLCDKAINILNSLLLEVNLVDIANDDQLLLTFGTRIPVLQRTDNHAELNWPFHAEDVTAFLKDYTTKKPAKMLAF